MVLISVATGLATEVKAGRGENLFREKCAVCHPDGNNSINDKTLKQKDLVKANLNSSDAFIKYLRTNNSPMPKFDKKELPDLDARELTGYILKTFK
jgi:cytochrome c6